MSVIRELGATYFPTEQPSKDFEVGIVRSVLVAAGDTYSTIVLEINDTYSERRFKLKVRSRADFLYGKYCVLDLAKKLLWSAESSAGGWIFIVLECEQQM